MEPGNLDELKELMPQSYGLEAYYDACVTVLHATFLRVSETFEDIRLPERPAKFLSASSEDGSRAASGTKMKAGWYPMSGRSLPPGVVRPPRLPILGVGFHLIAVARLGHVALIAFQWQETGEAIYVHTVDLHTFVDDPSAVGLVDTLVETNLLERLGRHWYERAKMYRINGLSFIEW